MRLLLLSLFFFCSGLARGQADSVKAPFLQYPFIPLFKVMTVPDSTVYTRDELPRKRPVILMVFDPDCEHCRVQAKDFITHIELLKKYHILMVSWLSFERIKVFYDELKLNNFPNITVARDSKGFFFTHFGLKAFPGIYSYDKKHRLLKNFESNIKIEKLLE